MVKNQFISDDFLLENNRAVALYHTYASKQPIIDYHNHLPPEEIAQDKVFENITQAWIYGDHYKWRAMRTAGINEDLITGGATDKQKFMAWAKTIPLTLRNPLYHWTHLELKRYFDIDILLNENSAPEIYQETAKQLKQPVNSARGLLNKMNVESLCTTEDPIDSLKHHKQLRNSDFKAEVGTAFRPDNALIIENPDYNIYLEELKIASGLDIRNYQDLKDALISRMDFFHANGCRLSDHGLDQLPFLPASNLEVEVIFSTRRNGEAVSPEQAEKFKTSLLLFLGQAYHQRGWVQQFHLGALRNVNSRMIERTGPNAGWCSIGDYQQALPLSRFLNELDRTNTLTKTIVYNSNPSDNEIFASMVGNFNDGSIRGKVQFGSGWWFLDQKQGIINQLNALSNMGLLSCFVGMLTDSRSFLSFPRHEYFRRVLCNLLGSEMHSGELPDDIQLIGKLVEDICYHNAKNYFSPGSP